MSMLPFSLTLCSDGTYEPSSGFSFEAVGVDACMWHRSHGDFQLSHESHRVPSPRRQVMTVTATTTPLEVKNWLRDVQLSDF